MKTLKTLVAVAVGALALSLNGAPGAEFGVSQASAQETVRKEVGAPLTEASKLYKAGKHKEALAKLKDAEAVANRTPAENFAIEGLRFSAAMGVSDADSMARSFDVLKAKLGAPQQLQYMEAIAGTYLRANNAAKALEWANKYFAAGGNSPAVKQMQQQAQFKSGDMTAVLKDTLAEVQAEDKAGRAPSQDKLNILLYAAQKKGDAATESYAVERLLNHYPRKELWAQVLGGLQGKKGFAPRFALDVYRLQLATGNLRGADDYMEMAQLAAQAGYPDEGKKVVEQGLAANILGQGAEGARHKRLLDLMVKKSNEAKADAANAEKAANDSKTGDELVKLGLSRVFAGDKAGGLKLVEAGIAKDNFSRADDAKFYQGLALYTAGETAKAQAAWRGVKGSDGSGELARLWQVQARSAKK
ncbi:hypothetical protein [Roseateles sp. BYS87W]|uniref:Tetratricopeptide repeat-containing protein n=1 Tax=Pelomonas baiyunensis TaxID=3299026 RepID=A0ABW7GWP8_9BURK